MNSSGMVAVTGLYQLKINYSKTKDMSIGTWITSPKFRVGRHEWVIKYFPQGNEKADNGKYVSVFLELQGESSNVKTTCEFALLGKYGTLPSTAMKGASHTFTSHDDDWGFSNFFLRTKLEQTYVIDCYFVLRVKITVKDESCTRAYWNANSIGFPHEDLQKLREEKIGIDVSFDVEGKIFVAHRVILAAHSPVFKAAFFGSMVESNRDCIIMIKEMMPSVFEAMIDFMYNGSLTVNVEVVDCEGSMSSTAFLQHLLVAADRYAVEKLKALCEYELVESISLDTVLSTLELAEMLNCTELKKHCLLFVVDKNNSVSLLSGEGYIQLMQNYTSLLAELEDLAEKWDLVQISKLETN